MNKTMKKYIDAELSIISINNCVIATSGEPNEIYRGGTLVGGQLGADRIRDDWDAGY